MKTPALLSSWLKACLYGIPPEMPLLIHIPGAAFSLPAFAGPVGNVYRSLSHYSNDVYIMSKDAFYVSGSGRYEICLIGRKMTH